VTDTRVLHRFTVRLLFFCLLSVSVLGAGGCAGPQRGITGQVVTALGTPVPNAQVSVVILPPGGIYELDKMVREGKPLYGWHFTTDMEGRFRLDGIPTGGLVVAGYTPSQTYTSRSSATAQGSAYGTGGYAYGSATGTGRTTTHVPGHIDYAYKPGELLGFVVRATGYSPYISTVAFSSPTGSMGKITLIGWSTGSLTIEKGQVRVSLLRANGDKDTDSVPSVEGQEPLKTPHGAIPASTLRTTTVTLPAHTLQHMPAPEHSKPPTWK